jgi:HEAT repeat protein
MRVNRTFLKLTPVLLATALITACSKTEQAMPAPDKSAPAQSAPAAAPTAAQPAMTPTPAHTPQFSATPAATTSVSPAQEAMVLENAYIATPDFSARVETIYKLTDAATPEAIASLGRLFHMEKDPELKTEILDSLFDIDGQDERKAALFAAGAGSDQPKEVRQSAIDGLEDVEAKYALPILQALTTDPDEDIRDAAKDAIESLQAAPPTPTPAQHK